MTNDTKRLIACILFGLAALGSFTTSYLHVVAYFTPVMPGAWPTGAYVAGLALDVLAVASGVGLILTTSGTPGRGWLHVGLWAPVALSVWANWRYAAEHVGAGAWAFDPVVSACLPVLLVIATHGLAAVLRAIPADAAEAAAVTAVPVAAPVKGQAAPAAPRPAPKAAPRPAGASPAEWHAPALALLRDGLRPADVARHPSVNVHPSQVTRLKARMGGMGVANG